MTGIMGRIKDFEIMQLSPVSNREQSPLVIAAGSSDGAVRLWNVFMSEIAGAPDAGVDGEVTTESDSITSKQAKQAGKLVGTLETGNRITCLGAFVMDEASKTPVLNGHDEMAGTVGDEGENGSEDADDE